MRKGDKMEEGSESAVCCKALKSWCDSESSLLNVKVAEDIFRQFAWQKIIPLKRYVCCVARA
jgi:hypothetical protein